MNSNTIERARRIAAICRTVPKEWADSAQWSDDELSQIGGLISCRFRVNCYKCGELDRAYIVETVSGGLTFSDVDESPFLIRDARSIHPIAVKSSLGDDVTDVVDEEHAERIIRLAHRRLGIERLLALYRNGLNEADGSEFDIKQWIGTGSRNQECASLIL